MSLQIPEVCKCSHSECVAKSAAAKIHVPVVGETPQFRLQLMHMHGTIDLTSDSNRRFDLRHVSVTHLDLSGYPSFVVTMHIHTVFILHLHLQFLR